MRPLKMSRAAKSLHGGFVASGIAAVGTASSNSHNADCAVCCLSAILQLTDAKLLPPYAKLWTDMQAICLFVVTVQVAADPNAYVQRGWQVHKKVHNPI